MSGKDDRPLAVGSDLIEIGAFEGLPIGRNHRTDSVQLKLFAGSNALTMNKYRLEC